MFIVIIAIIITYFTHIFTPIFVELLKQDFLGHKESIDLLDGLDFDFINGLRDDGDDLMVPGGGMDHHMMMMDEHGGGGSGGGGMMMMHGGGYRTNSELEGPEGMGLLSHKPRRDSIDNLFTNELINVDEYTGNQNDLIGGHNDHLHLLGGHEDGGILDHDELFNTFAKEDDELQQYHSSHRSNSMTSTMSSNLSPSPTNRSHKKSLRLPHVTSPDGYEDHNNGNNEDVDLSAYANYAAQLQNNREHQHHSQQYQKKSGGTIGGGEDVNNSNNKLLLKIKPSHHVAHIPTIGNPYAATTIPTTTSASEKMNKFGLRNNSHNTNTNLLTANNSNTNPNLSHTTIGGSTLKIPTVSNTSGYSPAVAVTIGGALKPIHLPNHHDPMLLLPQQQQHQQQTHPIISSMGDRHHPGNHSISSANLVNDLLHSQHIPRPTGYIGAYSPEQRRLRIEKFLEKRAKRVWTRKVKYDVRKNFADSRLRIKVSVIVLLIIV